MSKFDASMGHQVAESIEPAANQSTDRLDVGANSDMQLAKRKGFLKRMSKFIFSHVGLVVMVIIYAVAGALLFELLEQHEEAKDCQEGKGAEATYIVNLKSELLTYIQFNISSNPSDTTKDNETVANQKIEDWLTSFRDEVLSNKDVYRYTGQDCTSAKWNFAGALLFAITIITTIGKHNNQNRSFWYSVCWPEDCFLLGVGC
jgi:hypothetical protein